MTMSRQGEPRVLYTRVGVLFLGVFDNDLAQFRVDSYVREILVDFVVISVVAIAAFSNRNTRS